jgi:hypothetical protein
MKSIRTMVVVVIAIVSVATQGRSAQKPLATPSTGTLQVSQKGDGPMFDEGSITFFRVFQNEKLVEEKMLGGEVKKVFGQAFLRSTTAGDKNSFSLPPGQYEVRGYVRVCNGNCNILTAPQDECRGGFKMSAGETVEAVRRQTRTGRCTMEISLKRK